MQKHPISSPTRKRSMVVFKSFKGEKYLSVFAFVVFVGFFFFLSTNPVQKIGAPWLRKTQYGLEGENLTEVLKKASMPDKTVILTTLNEAWATPGSILDLFLESFHLGVGTPRLLNHLVIVAMDPKAFDRCNSVHNHCFFLKTPGVNFTSEKRFMSEDYLKLMWRRIDFLRTVLELGYNFIFTDADIMWFRDPFPYLDAPDEIQIACDFYNGSPKDEGNRPNGGFNFVRSNETTINFYKYWYMARLLHPGQHDQAVFEMIRNDAMVAATGVKITYLDTLYFGGFCQPSKDMNKVSTMHANCCVGIERKIYDLNLLLSDWKNFTAFPQGKEQGGNPSNNSSPWTAPHKCKEGWN